MYPVLHAIHTEWQAARPVAVATVIETHGSAPRDPGAMLAVRHDGTVVGSISGGCVEGALYETALDVLASGRSQIERYGPSGDLFEPGLTCGGMITVLVERIDPDSMPQIGDMMKRILRDETVVLETVLRGEDAGTHRVANDVDDSSGINAAGNLVRRFDSRPRMVIVGSTDFAAETGSLAVRMGYHVTICDARPVFTTLQRFPEVDDVVCAWPSDWIAEQRRRGRFDARSVVVVLTHDPKIDIPVLVECLDDSKWQVPLLYIGAMGSRLADANRRRQLAEKGLRSEQIAGLSSPIGLDIGNRGPVETAVSIAAQIIDGRRERNQASGPGV